MCPILGGVIYDAREEAGAYGGDSPVYFQDGSVAFGGLGAGDDLGKEKAAHPQGQQKQGQGQQKKSRKNRKPKKEKVKTNASNPRVKPGSVKGLENMKNS